ncbi:MAG TPA: outer membrane beta-barrel protein [Pyrinomonadaceae bacterium]|nr:outer membrane beta-barrel protein [Pyrinomonadaceae bacterium]
MRKAIFMIALLLLLRLQAAGQETPRVEVFGGYSYAGGNFHGWNASVTGNVNDWFGVVADFSGHYGGSIDEDGFDERQRAHSYLFGPRVSVRRKRVTPFAHALFGASKLETDLSGFGQRFFFSDTGFSFVVGGGLDVRVNDRVAVRAFQLDYLRTRFFGEAENHGRLAFGLVLRFGKK